MKYQHKATEVEAIYWDGNYATYEKIFPWANDSVVLNTVSNHITIKPSGLTVVYGEWLIKTEDGEIYPCKADTFAKNYDRIEDA